MVVDDIKDDTDLLTVCAIYKLAELLGTPIQPRGREQAHSVITPPESAREFGNRHNLHHRDAELPQFAELRRRRLPGAFFGKRPDVHLIHHLSLELHAPPMLVGPGESGFDHLRIPMWAIGLEA